MYHWKALVISLRANALANIILFSRVYSSIRKWKERGLVSVRKFNSKKQNTDLDVLKMKMEEKQNDV